MANRIESLGWEIVRIGERLLADTRTIYVSGWIGSGSTFVYQCLNDLGIQVTKVHGFPKRHTGAFSVFTIRDPRDIAVSTARRQFREVLEKSGKEEAIMRAIDLLERRSMLKELELCLANRNRMVVRYENFFGGNEVQLIRILADQITPRLLLPEILEVVEANSLEANRGRMQQMANFSEWDKESLIHGNHISTGGQTGIWREEFNDAVTEYFYERLGELLVASGYER